MSEQAEFKEFPKIYRLNREVIITEKIDGTNAQVFIGENGEFMTGSRNQWIGVDGDNHGFAKWANENKEALLQLGPGRHFGEWWGSGIQRGYGLPKGEKRFSLFNVQRWCLKEQEPQRIIMADPRIEKYQEVLPEVCGLVPVIARGLFTTELCQSAVALLREKGSLASPGFMKPEGIVIFHTQGNFGLKVTLEKDEQPKGFK